MWGAIELSETELGNLYLIQGLSCLSLWGGGGDKGSGLFGYKLGLYSFSLHFGTIGFCAGQNLEHKRK